MKASTIEEFKTSVEFENILSKEFLKDHVKDHDRKSLTSTWLPFSRRLMILVASYVYGATSFISS